MSGWNHRVVYHPPSKVEMGNGKKVDVDEYLAIHEVYYDDNDIPNAMTVDEIVVGDEGVESLQSLRWILEHQLEALDKPILSNVYENGRYEEISKEKQNEFSKGDETQEQVRTEDFPTSDGHPTEQ